MTGQESGGNQGTLERNPAATKNQMHQDRCLFENGDNLVSYLSLNDAKNGRWKLVLKVR